MRTLYIASTFSAGMLPLQRYTTIVVDINVLDARQAREVVQRLKELGWKIVSCVGHESTAAILSELLGVEVRVNRVAITVEPGDAVLALVLTGRPPRELSVAEVIRMLSENRAFFVLAYITGTEENPVPTDEIIDRVETAATIAEADLELEKQRR